MSYDVAAIREKLKKQMSGKFTDPDEFRPPKAESSEPIKFRFFILPPLFKGDKIKSGVVDKTMEQFFVTHGNHWINDKPHPCPRIWDGTDCDICQTGFDLLKEEKDEDKRKAIVKAWMPSAYYMVNIYFTSSSVNPEELRGKVKFFNAPKTCFDIWTSTLLKDDAGDADDPTAFGVFFDENSAFQFQLEVAKNGRNNSYKTSKFIANGGEPTPMLKDKDKLAKLLEMRHNLFAKIEMPDPAKIKKLASAMLDGDDSDDGFDEDEASDKKATQTKAAAKIESAKAEKPKTSPKKEVIEEDEDMLVDESPLVDEEPKAKKKPETKKPETKKVAEEVVDDEEEDNDELNALLEQLKEDDDD